MTRGIITFVLLWLAMYTLFLWTSKARLKDGVWLAHQAIKAASVTTIVVVICLLVIYLF